MNNRHYEALARLRGNEDFKEVLAWITRLREKCKEDLTSANASVIQQLQGRAQAYGTILEAESSAVEVLSRSKSTPSTGSF